MFVLTCAEMSFSKALIIYAELLFWLLHIIFSLPWEPETQNTQAVNFSYPYSVLINLIGVLRKVTKNGTLWLHLSAPVYFPNYLFSSLPYINSTAFSPAMHLQESRHCSTLLHFTHPRWSCQLNLAASRISVTTDGNSARLFLALNVRRCYSPRFWVNHLSR